MASRYERDELFLALQRVANKTEEEAGALMDKTNTGLGSALFVTKIGPAKKLVSQFNNQNPRYRISLWGVKGAPNKSVFVYVRSLCMEPNAPWVKCCICDTPVKTCERKVPRFSDYRCPVHPEGKEVSDGGWVCSHECWEITGGLPLDKDRAEKIL